MTIFRRPGVDSVNDDDTPAQREKYMALFSGIYRNPRHNHKKGHRTLDD
tara:strand:- start:121 stop:267 length:147 start_codon:yes stop_codon:yes gene_type:complete